MKQTIRSVLLSSLAIAFLDASYVSAETKNWIGCPVQSINSIDPGPRLSVSWSITGMPPIVSFQADKILLGGGSGNVG